MVRALENLGTDSSYLEFFGLTRPPFARLSQASEIFDTDQYSLLTAHLASATQQADCLVVICGANGSGKTTLLNRYIASLSDDTSYASIDETCNGEKQFYCAFLRQLGFNDITGTPRELKRITKEFLVHRGMAGDPVLLMVDNAHLVNPTVLEQLRWISAIRVNDRRVISVILVGNSDLARIMDSPAMSQTRFHGHIRFNIRAYSEDEIGNYIQHRLKSAGAADTLKFSDELLPLICRYTGGVPSLINMLCNAVLTEAHTRKTRDITEELVRAVAEDRQLLPHVVPLQGKGRRKTDPDFKLVQSERQTGEPITARGSTTKESVEIPTLSADTSDSDAKDFLARITRLSVELGELRANRIQALQVIGRRDTEIRNLREKLDAQTAETEKLASALGSNSDEIARLNQALSNSKVALKENEKASMKLAADLEKARSARKAVQADSIKANAKAEELSQLKSELQASVSGLTADLQLADQRVADVDALEMNFAALEDEIENKTGELLTLRGELDSRDEALGDLEKLIEELQNECATLRLSAASLEDLEGSVSEKEAHIADLNAELAHCRQEIKTLEARNREIESRGTVSLESEGISALESDLQEVSQMLRETRAHLTELPTLIAQSTPETRDSPTSEIQPVEIQLESKQLSPATITELEVVKDGRVQQVMKVVDSQSRIMIGRAEDSDLCLDSGFVSRHHALVFCSEQGTYIEDLNSFNGTIVNSGKTSRCELEPGDVVAIGDFQIRPR